MKLFVAMPLIAGTMVAFALVAPRKTQTILDEKEAPCQEPPPQRSLKAIRAVRVRPTLTVVPPAAPALQPEPEPVHAVERGEDVADPALVTFESQSPMPQSIAEKVVPTPEPPQVVQESAATLEASTPPSVVLATTDHEEITTDEVEQQAKPRRTGLGDLIGALLFGGRKRQSTPRPSAADEDAVDMLSDDSSAIVGDVMTVADAVCESVENSTPRRVRPAVAPPAIIAAESAELVAETVLEEQPRIERVLPQPEIVEVSDKAQEVELPQVEQGIAPMATDSVAEIPSVAVTLEEPTARTIQRVAQVISMFAFRRKHKAMNAADVLSADSARRIIDGVAVEEEAVLPPDDIPHLSPERIAAADERLQEIADTPVFEAPAVAVAIVPGWANEYAALEMDVTVEGRERLVACFGLLDHQDLVESLNRVFLSEDSVRVRVLGLTLIGERHLVELAEIAKRAGTSSDPYERCAAVLALGGCGYGEFVVIFLEDEDSAVVRTAVAQIVELFEGEFARAKVEESNGPHKQLASDTLELLLGE